MLKVGLVGSGFMGAIHAAGWTRTPAELSVVMSKDDLTAQQLGEKYGCDVYETLDELIEAVDVVDICTPTHRHYEMVLKAAAAGKHIVCEKPMARNLQQAREMVAACEKAGVQLLIAHVVRFFPQYARAKEVVDRGDIGRVAVVRLTRCSFGTTREWFHDYEKSGGMMLDLMIHDFDYARWVAGDVDSVFAKHVGDQKDDYSLAILRHKNGAISHIEGGWAYPAPMFRTALEIAGDRGLIEHPADGSQPLGVFLKTQPSSDAPDIAVPSSPLAEDPYTTEIRHFYEVLTRGIAPRVTAQDGFAALQIATAAIESARTGRRVNLEEVQ